MKKTFHCDDNIVYLTKKDFKMVKKGTQVGENLHVPVAISHLESGLEPGLPTTTTPVESGCSAPDTGISA